MTTTTPRQELQAMIGMLSAAIDEVEAEGGDATAQRALRTKYEIRVSHMVGDGGSIKMDLSEARDLLSRPAGGAAAKNQYGTFKVHYATDKQQAFALSLMDRKDTSKLATGVAPLDPAKVRETLVARQFNKKSISALIDRLLGCPDKAAAPGAPAPTGRPATEKQVTLINKLAAERELDPVEREALTKALPLLSTKGASKTIDNLMARPKATAVPTAAIEAGVYINDTTGVILRAYLGKQSGRILCKEVVKVEGAEPGEREYELEYRGQADRFVTADFRRMSLEEAKAWGRTTSHCCACGARLDDPASVDAGIGPICAAKAF